MPMTMDDLDAVLAIEVRAHHSPWTRGNFMDTLKTGHTALLMRENDALLGYAVLMPIPGEAELLDIAVAPERQGDGLGRRLLGRVCDDAKAQGAARMFLEVRASNAPARALYAGSGFVETGLRKDYYATADNRREDAILMVKTL